MSIRTLGVYLGLAVCVAACRSSISQPIEGCSKTACDSRADAIEEEDAAHPEFNPDHREDVCGDESKGEEPLPHYAEACEELRNCRIACGLDG